MILNIFFNIRINYINILNFSNLCQLFQNSVNGTWNAWTEWGGCSVSCADGIKLRNRTCLGPFYGGDPCPGSYGSETDCFLRHCPSRIYSRTDFSTYPTLSCEWLLHQPISITIYIYIYTTIIFLLRVYTGIHVHIFIFPNDSIQCVLFTSIIKGQTYF